MISINYNPGRSPEYVRDPSPTPSSIPTRASSTYLPIDFSSRERAEETRHDCTVILSPRLTFTSDDSSIAYVAFNAEAEQ